MVFTHRFEIKVFEVWLEILFKLLKALNLSKSGKFKLFEIVLSINFFFQSFLTFFLIFLSFSNNFFIID